MNKKNLILIIVLILLVAVAYVYQGPWQNWQANKNLPKNFLAGVNVDQVNKIEITKNGEKTTLVLSGGRWKIDGTKDFYVSDANAQNVVARLKDLVAAQLEIASTNQAKKQDFNTDAVSGVSVKLEQGNKELASFVVGKITSDYTGAYLSPASNSSVTYLTKVDMYDAFVQTDWYDKTIFTSDKTKINKIRVQLLNKEFTAEKTGETWSAGAVKLDSNKVANIVDLMSSSIASEIPEQKFDGTGLEKNQIIVQATGDGVDNTIIIGNDNGQGLYYAKRGDSDNIYLIAEAERDKLNVRIKELQ